MVGEKRVNTTSPNNPYLYRAPKQPEDHGGCFSNPYAHADAISKNPGIVVDGLVFVWTFALGKGTCMCVPVHVETRG